jgi:hypothetical protein
VARQLDSVRYAPVVSGIAPTSSPT